jgi:biopolymer transport protein ExbD
MMEAIMPGRSPVAQTIPFMEINTTPLIDVLLVLLVMLIITVPIQSHAVKLDLPQPCTACAAPNALKNEIAIDRSDAIRWNGRPITMDALRYNLRLTQQMQPIPELHLRPDANARYGRIDEVLAAIKREHVQKFGFIGNEAYQAT